jgi:hypothetical protein
VLHILLIDFSSFVCGSSQNIDSDLLHQLLFMTRELLGRSDQMDTPVCNAMLTFTYEPVFAEPMNNEILWQCV